MGQIPEECWDGILYPLIIWFVLKSNDAASFFFEQDDVIKEFIRSIVDFCVVRFPGL